MRGDEALYEADARAGYSFTETVATGTMSQAIGEAPKPTMVEVKRRYRGVRAHGVCKDLADMLIVTPTR